MADDRIVGEGGLTSWSDRMDLAVHVTDYTWPGGTAALVPTLTAIADAADTGGFATLTLMDHWFQMDQDAPAGEPILAGYTTLGFLAGRTRRVQLGLLVTGATYRHPGLLAKAVATLDVLSGGRAVLGVGAAWYEREHRGLGVPFPPVAERFERLEETVLICRQMWSDDDGPYAGRHYSLAETLCSPRPVQQPRPPIVIGGNGERKTLRLVARHADACNLSAAGLAEVARKLQVLARHCDAENRDPATVQKTVISGDDPLVDIEAFLTSMRAYTQLGITKAWVGPPRGHPDPAGWVAGVADRVLPAVRDL
jgi:F420-dependent oxidoreductase-like protein